MNDIENLKQKHEREQIITQELEDQIPPMLYLDQKLNQLIEKWQSKLKLNHWMIDYKMCDRDEMGGEFHGKCRHHLETLKAEILVITEAEFLKFQKNAFIKESYDLEETVVHELVHILLASMRCPNGETEEQTVNIITRILLER